ncbi:hypothetical protein J3E72DRAFT_308031, partial [Bipolaris maydis]|uniref:uncharacterized protein n=1 Tax=Cochliobolus heterostrophus TaxID=5016 RepID=UPI0024D0E378
MHLNARNSTRLVALTALITSIISRFTCLATDQSACRNQRRTLHHPHFQPLPLPTLHCQQKAEDITSPSSWQSPRGFDTPYDDPVLVMIPRAPTANPPRLQDSTHNITTKIFS